MINYFVFQAEDGIRDLVRSRGLGDVYKRQRYGRTLALASLGRVDEAVVERDRFEAACVAVPENLSLIHI